MRELENVAERAVVLSTQNRIDMDLLPEAIQSKEIVRGVRLQLSEFLPPLPGEPGARAAADNPQPSLFQIMDEIERRIIVDMLERTNWNQTEAKNQAPGDRCAQARARRRRLERRFRQVALRTGQDLSRQFFMPPKVSSKLDEPSSL